MKCPNCKNEMVQSRAGWLCLSCGHVEAAPVSTDPTPVIDKGTHNSGFSSAATAPKKPKFPKLEVPDKIEKKPEPSPPPPSQTPPWVDQDKSTEKPLPVEDRPALQVPSEGADSPEESQPKPEFETAPAADVEPNVEPKMSPAADAKPSIKLHVKVRPRAADASASPEVSASTEQPEAKSEVHPYTAPDDAIIKSIGGSIESPSTPAETELEPEPRDDPATDTEPKAADTNMDAKPAAEVKADNESESKPEDTTPVSVPSDAPATEDEPKSSLAAEPTEPEEMPKPVEPPASTTEESTPKPEGPGISTVPVAPSEDMPKEIPVPEPEDAPASADEAKTPAAPAAQDEPAPTPDPTPLLEPVPTTQAADAAPADPSPQNDQPPFTPTTQPKPVKPVTAAGIIALVAVTGIISTAVYLNHPTSKTVAASLNSSASAASQATPAATPLNPTPTPTPSATTRPATPLVDGDAQRKADLASYLTAYKAVAAAANGFFPVAPPAVSVQATDPGTGQAYAVSTAKAATIGQIQYWPGGSCAGKAITPGATGTRYLALVTELQSGTTYCLDAR